MNGTHEMKTLVVHENSWPWGRTVSFVFPDGKAMVDMSFDDEDIGVCYISGLRVTKDVRRKGRARFLMLSCIDYCERAGIFRIDLKSVDEDFVIEFYHSLGFEDIKEQDGFVIMSKMLKG